VGLRRDKWPSAVQLRFDVRRSPSLPEAVRVRLLRLAGRRITSEGVLVITAGRFRSQQQNRDDARQRLLRLLHAAAAEPRVRRPTKPPRAAREKRREGAAVIRESRHRPCPSPSGLPARGAAYRP
jgi:ribosome-associated protein